MQQLTFKIHPSLWMFSSAVSNFFFRKWIEHISPPLGAEPARLALVATGEVEPEYKSMMVIESPRFFA